MAFPLQQTVNAKNRLAGSWWLSLNINTFLFALPTSEASQASAAQPPAPHERTPAQEEIMQAFLTSVSPGVQGSKILKKKKKKNHVKLEPKSQTGEAPGSYTPWVQR